MTPSLYPRSLLKLNNGTDKTAKQKAKHKKVCVSGNKNFPKRIPFYILFFCSVRLAIAPYLIF